MVDSWRSKSDQTGTITEWARVNGYIVFTHDLDFGAILAVTHAQGPSVIQVRTQDVTPGHLEQTVITALDRHRSLLEQGALIILDEVKARVTYLAAYAVTNERSLWANEANRIYPEKNANPAFRGTVSVGHRILRGPSLKL